MRDETQLASKLVLSYHNISVKEHDMDSLKEHKNINDTVIGFYMEWLQHNEFKDNYEMLFVEPSVVQHLKLSAYTEDTLVQMDIDSREFIILPMSDSQTEQDRGRHWYLIIFSRRDKRCYVYDSNYNTEVVGMWYRTCQHFMDLFNIRSFLFENVECLQQRNVFDCGLHVMTNAGIVARHIVTNGTCASANVTDPNCLLSRTDIITQISTTAAELKNANNGKFNHSTKFTPISIHRLMIVHLSICRKPKSCDTTDNSSSKCITVNECINRCGTAAPKSKKRQQQIVFVSGSIVPAKSKKKTEAKATETSHHHNYV